MQSWSRYNSTFLSLVLLLSVLAGSAARADERASQHHVIIEQTDFVNDYLPPGLRTEMQGFRMDEQLRTRILEKYAVSPDDRTYTLILSRDRSGAHLQGGVIIMESAYQQGSILLALVLSDELRVLKAAILEVSPDDQQDFEATTGTGILTRYTMVSARQLRYLASVLKKQGEAAALVGQQLYKMGALLATVMDHPA